MNLQENLEQIRKNSEQMSWSGCGNCSRRKFYQTGYEDGLKESDEELRELREYKNKVEMIYKKRINNRRNVGFIGGANLCRLALIGLNHIKLQSTEVLQCGIMMIRSLSI